MDENGQVYFIGHNKFYEQVFDEIDLLLNDYRFRLLV